MNPSPLIQYPAGSLLRVRQICRQPAKGGQGEVPGLLPIVSRTWLKWVDQGKVPQGVKIGAKTRAWRIEDVLEVGRIEEADA